LTYQYRCPSQQTLDETTEERLRSQGYMLSSDAAGTERLEVD
jgi:hypothetical protein